MLKQAWRSDEETSCGKERRDEKLIRGEILRMGGRAAELPLPRGGRRAHCRLLTRLRAKAEEPDGTLVNGVV